MHAFSLRSLLIALAIALPMAASAPAFSASKSDLENSSKKALDKLSGARASRLATTTRRVRHMACRREHSSTVTRCSS